MNLIPERFFDTGNYFCTWDSQGNAMYLRNPYADSIPCRDAMCEEFLFGDGGLLNSFSGVRGDLIVVLDDGWDVPYGATDTRVFGSLEVDPERFPSLKNLSPAKRLKALNEKVVSLGYRGMGLWVPTQMPYLVDGKEVARTAKEERLHWEERARWCHEAGILYWKADWGKYQGDPQYAVMMSECVRKFAPNLKLEHGFVEYQLLESETSGYEPADWQKDYLKEVLPVDDYLRTYDVVHELKYASTVNRTAICLEAAAEIDGPCAVLNVEDTALIGAALGCSIGVMRHDFEKNGTYVPLPARPVSEIECALRWQRIAPPFSANIGKLEISKERLMDVWHCPERAANLWPSLPQGDYYVTAPSAISRNMPLPKVTAKGDKPYVVSSVHPENKALCVAVTPRSINGKIHLTPLAEISVKGGVASALLGVFGRFNTLSVEFDEEVENCRVFAQNMLSNTAQEVTGRVLLSGNMMTIGGDLMLQIGTPEDAESSIPAVVFKLIFDL